MTQNTTILSGTYSTDFKDGSTYPVHQLRSIAGVLATKGVLPDAMDSLKVMKSGKNQVKILPGRGIFEDGGLFTVNSEGVILEVPTGSCYVSLQNGHTREAARPVVSVQPPGSDAIPLAFIGEDGSVTDTRISTNLKLREE